MTKKPIAVLVSLLTLGASASVFAGPACCAAGAKEASAVQAGGSANLILASYEKISNALAADDLAEAQAAARTFAAAAESSQTKLGCVEGATKECGTDKKAEKVGEACGDGAIGCGEHVQAFIDAKDIVEGRAQFKLISAQAIELAEKAEGYVVMNCSMAGENADWLQSDREVRNPYHGGKMLRCGTVKTKES